MKKKTLALLLALAMVVTGLIPSTLAVLAAESNDQQVILSQNVSPLQQGPSVSASNVSGGGNLQPSGSSEQGSETSPVNPLDPDGNGIGLDKNVQVNYDGTYTITMEAFTTGEVISSETVVPLDIVLVLDQSGSMAYDFNGKSSGYDASRQKAMKDAVKGFIDQVNSKFNAQNADHRVAIVTFESGAQTLIGWTDANATDNKGKNLLKKAIDGLPKEPEGGTQTDLGMAQAEVLMGDGYNYTGENPAKRQKVVILFTDGVPGNYGFNISIANGAIGSAKNLKDSGCIVYAVGIFEGANPDELYGSSETIVTSQTAQEWAENKGVWENYKTGNIFRPIHRTGLANSLPENPTEGQEYTFTYYVHIFLIGDIEHTQQFIYHNGEWYVGYHYETNGTPGEVGYRWKGSNDDIPASNRFLNYLSSNYPNAADLGLKAHSKDGSGDDAVDSDFEITANYPPRNPNGDYYLTADNADALNNIFQSISEQIGAPSIELGTDTVITDIVTPYFTVPDNADIAFYTADYQGSQNWAPRADATGLTHEVVDRTLTVSGFDYNANFVSEDPRSEADPTQPGDFRGRKLIIEFTVSPRPGFLGGNNVPTNGEGSGICDSEGNILEAFPVPTVDVPIPDIEVIAPDKNVYLTNSLTNSDLVYSGQYIIHANSGDITFDFSKPYGGLEYWQFEFLDVGYNLAFGKDGQPLYDDCQYKLDFVLRPKTEGTYGEKRAERATGNIYVYKPVITYADEKADHGAILDLTDNQTVPMGLVWKHGSYLAGSDIPMDGTEPALGYTYYVYPETEQQVVTPETFAFNYWEDQYIKVKVNIAGTDITKYVTFLHLVCDITPDCPLTVWQKDNGNTNDAPGQFMIHILNNCFLTINKEAAEGTTFAPGESFIFDVTGPDGYSIRVVLTADENGYVAPVTIEQLYAGEYTVTEDTGWSWRYEAVGSGTETVAISQDNPGEVTIANKLINDDWLHWETTVDNRWGKNDAGEVVITPHKKPELPAQP